MSKPGNRYVTITDDDHGGELWITVVIALCCSIVICITRFCIKARNNVSSSRDDAVIVGACALLLVQCALVMAALVLGLGKDDAVIDPANVQRMFQIYQASQAIYYLVLYAVKCTMILLIAKVFSKRLTWICGVMASLAIVSIIVVTAGCSRFECANSGPSIRWAFLTASDIGTEIIITALPLMYLRNIQMDIKGKTKVICSFNSRLPTVAFSALVLWAVTRTTKDSSDELTHSSVNVILPAVLQQSELAWSFLTAAILPCFRIVFASSHLQRIELNEHNADLYRNYGRVNVHHNPVHADPTVSKQDSTISTLSIEPSGHSAASSVDSTNRKPSVGTSQTKQSSNPFIMSSR